MIAQSLRFCLSVVAMLLAQHAYADKIDYVIGLRVTFVSQVVPPECALGVGHGGFGCSNAVGDVHLGRFSVDDQLLKNTGDNVPGNISNFLLGIFTVVWGPAHPFPLSDFLGFRGPNPMNGCSICIVEGAPSPGFDVHGGQITGLTGGVFGLGDVPWVDFLGTTFSAVDVDNTNLTGTLQVTAIPEPSTVLLVGIGLALITVRAKRSHARIRGNYCVASVSDVLVSVKSEPNAVPVTNARRCSTNHTATLTLHQPAQSGNALRC